MPSTLSPLTGAGVAGYLLVTRYWLPVSWLPATSFRHRASGNGFPFHRRSSQASSTLMVLPSGTVPGSHHFFYPALWGDGLLLLFTACALSKILVTRKKLMVYRRW